MFGVSDISVGYAIAYSLLGMLIVFAMLILLWAIVAIMASSLKRKNTATAVAAASSAPLKPADTVKPAAPVQQPAAANTAAQIKTDTMQYREDTKNSYTVTLLDKVYEVKIEAAGTAQSFAAAAVPVRAAQAPSAIPQAAVQQAAPAPVVQAAPAPVQAAPVPTAGSETIVSPLPGTIFKVNVSSGERVKAGQLLLIIEAMKMENEILAPRDGTVVQVMVSAGATVASGAPMLVLE